MDDHSKEQAQGDAAYFSTKDTTDGYLAPALAHEITVHDHQAKYGYQQGYDGEDHQHTEEPFFTTKRSGSGIGLSLSRRMMIQQGGMLDLAEKPLSGCHAGFILTILISQQKQ